MTICSAAVQIACWLFFGQNENEAKMADLNRFNSNR